MTNLATRLQQTAQQVQSVTFNSKSNRLNYQNLEKFELNVLKCNIYNVELSQINTIVEHLLD